jgi:hypothetical protein
LRRSLYCCRADSTGARKKLGELLGWFHEDVGLLDHERDAVKAEALARVRAALVTGEGIGAALRWCWYRNPLFAATLFTEAVRTRFGRDCDVRDLTRFIARHCPAGPAGSAGFPAREAEALMRAALGEAALFSEVDPGHFSYPEICITLTGALLREWRPGPEEAGRHLDRVADTVRAAHDLSPGLAPAEEDWFAASMHDSPFARWGCGELDGVPPGR